MRPRHALAALLVCPAVLSGQEPGILRVEITLADAAQSPTPVARHALLVSDNPAMALTLEMFPGQVKHWGLSFVINTEAVPGGRGAGSLTWAGVHNTFYWIDPVNRLTALLMMQLLPANDPKVLEVLVGYEQALYGALRR